MAQLRPRQMNNTIVITGQTATGKTSYAHKLALESNGELINCDSRQVYKYLDIVTGKDRLDNTPIWLYDIVDPNQPFSSSEWASAAREAIEAIQKREKTPIIVGGTYLYLKNLLYGFATETIGPDWQLRERLGELSVEELQEKMMDLNYDAFDAMNNSDQNNPRRLMRKIEIAQANTPTPSKHIHEELKIDKFIGLRFKDEEKLRNTIEKRVQKRISGGAIEETRDLLSRGYSKIDPGLQTIGYKQIIQFLEESISEKEMIQLWITAEVQYAKRQYTFMKKDTNIVWHDI